MVLASRRERIYSQFPEPVSGYELDPERGYFTVIIPEATTNLVTNPTIQNGVSTGYTLDTGAMSIRSDWQAYGTYSIRITPAILNESGFYYGNVTLAASTTYTASMVIQGEEGKIYYIWFASTAGALIGTKRPWIGTGHKQRIWVTTVEPTGAARRVYVTRDARYTDQNFFYADGLQVEEKAYPTTYCDGDQVGFVIGEVAYRWNGTPHASTSTRSAQTRAGGREVNLLDLGIRVLAILGLGMAPLVDQALPMPGRGELAQGTGTQAREFTLVSALYADGPGPRHLQALRSGLIDAFKPDLITTEQPLILRYQACDDEGDPLGESLDIVCKYRSGLEGNWDNHQQERLALNFKMHLPLILSTYDSGTTLGFQTEITNANYGVQQDSAGNWTRISAAISDFIYKFVKGANGLVYMGGAFTNLGDANGDGIVSISSTGAMLSLGTGVAGGGGIARAFVLLPNGNLYVGGTFTSAGGVAATARIAMWDGTAWNSVGGGIASGQVYEMAYDAAHNCIYVGGSFTNHGDANGDYITRYDVATNTWSSLDTGANDIVYAVHMGADGQLYAGGAFTSIGSGGSPHIARWNGVTWGAVGEGTSDDVESFAVGLDGMLYVGGSFAKVFNRGDILGVQGTSLIAKWNGTTWSSLAGGAVGTAIWSLQVTSNGVLHAGGNFTSIGGITVPDSAAFWNGWTWVPIDINLPGDAIITSMLIDEQFGKTYVGYTTTGSAYSATVTAPNLGSATAYPKVIFTGPGRIYQLKSYTTGKAIYFDYLMQAGEVAILDLNPQHISFVSYSFGAVVNVMHLILPGSNLNFPLLPGVNNISCYMFGSTTAATSIVMSWRGQYWSLDGAAWK